MNSEDNLNAVGNKFASDEIPARPDNLLAVYKALREPKRWIALLKW